MYTVNGVEHKDYFAAIEDAKEKGAQVLDAGNGLVRWEPAPAVSAKKMRQYREQKAAHEAYLRSRKQG